MGGARDATFLWDNDSHSPNARINDDMENARIDESDGETQAQIVKYKNTIANKFQSPPRHHHKHPAELEEMENEKIIKT